ncbi:peptidase S10 serine carboxypeptidase [Suillus spraguei]|nr:peptidase S10 serine carboxypeptidase [Suillus spraguei]
MTKVLSLLPLVLVILAILAGRAENAQVVLGRTGHVQSGPFHMRDAVEGIIDKGEDNVQWIEDGKQFIKKHGLTYELVQHPRFVDHKLRVTEPKLCDPSVQQYSGYIDITDDKHLFFWFFESRSSPEYAPLMLWLNGGPGSSSSVGLLFEVGPCSIADEGAGTTFNPHSWNTHANIIFLDQPVNVGYSYSDDGSVVDSSPVAGKDVYAFMQLFLSRFPKYATQPFHITTQSYGGIFGPNIANVIFTQNQKLRLSPDANIVKIKLASIMLGNGMTDNYVQMAVLRCQDLIKICRELNTRWTCANAATYCFKLYNPIRQSGFNPFDVRITCNREIDGPLCYRQIGWIETYLNNPEVKAALGVNPEREFESCSLTVNDAFMNQGDSMHDTPLLLTDMVNSGVRLLIYAGNTGIFQGNERWVEQLNSIFFDEFSTASTEQWITMSSGKVAGTVRSAGRFGGGNVVFVTVHESGHMVGHDQPEAALDMMMRWIMDLPLTVT